MRYLALVAVAVRVSTRRVGWCKLRIICDRVAREGWRLTTGTTIALGLVIGAALSLALRHVADVVAGLMLNACRGGGRETWPPHR